MEYVKGHENFGELPDNFSGYEKSKAVILPFPYEKTTSYGKETLAKLFGKEEAPVEATKTEAATPSEEKATQEDKN